MNVALTRIDRVMESFRSTADEIVESAPSMPSSCLRLREAAVPPDFPPGEAVMRANEGDERIDIQIEVPSYGTGAITIFVD